MYKVLIIDDEAPARIAISRLGHWADYHITELYQETNGAAALKTMREIKPQIVFVDMQMPVMNGMEFLEKASHEFRDTCFIVISGYDYFDYAKAALKCGAIDYLLKPINKKEIHKVLDDLMFWYNSETSNLKERVTFKTINGLITIYIDDLLYFEYNNRRIDIVTKTNIYHMYDKIKSIVSKMNKYDFVSPHAAYVINLKEVSQYIKSENRIIMTNGKNIPISQLKTKKFKEEYLNHINKTWERK